MYLTCQDGTFLFVRGGPKGGGAATSQFGILIGPVNSKNTWNDNLAAIFEAKLKAAIDNRGVKTWQFSNTVFDPNIWPFWSGF